jgi:hypothetical protein
MLAFPLPLSLMLELVLLVETFKLESNYSVDKKSHRSSLKSPADENVGKVGHHFKALHETASDSVGVDHRSFYL